MQTSILVFPGSNCDRDSTVAIERITGHKPTMVWHRETSLPQSDLIIVPGGFSHGDYLRSGAMAARAPIMKDVVAKAKAGVAILGICNGFQILTEAGLLPGALMRNRDLKFICKDVHLRVERNDTIFTTDYKDGGVIRIPVAHHDGNYFASDDVIASLEGEGQVAFRYCSLKGAINEEANPNGSANNIAGIYDKTSRILGLMPHPERLIEDELGGIDGRPMYSSLLEALA